MFTFKYLISHIIFVSQASIFLFFFFFSNPRLLVLVCLALWAYNKPKIMKLSYAVAKNILPRTFCCLISINQHDVVLSKRTVNILCWTLHPAQYSKSAKGWPTHIAVSETLVILWQNLQFQHCVLWTPQFSRELLIMRTDFSLLVWASSCYCFSKTK